MRQTHFKPVPLRPTDVFDLTHRIRVKNDSSRPVTVVGVRWELVFAEELSANDRQLLENAAVTTVS